MMEDKSKIISQICEKLKSGHTDAALDHIKSDWPFEPSSSEPKRENITHTKQIKVFFRDNFICQYCGKRTIFIGTLRAIYLLLGDDFPYQTHWKWNRTHPAF